MAAFLIVLLVGIEMFFLRQERKIERARINDLNLVKERRGAARQAAAARKEFFAIRRLFPADSEEYQTSLRAVIKTTQRMRQTNLRDDFESEIAKLSRMLLTPRARP
jgi:uncharacterized protein YdaU (DUF1376 family)